MPTPEDSKLSRRSALKKAAIAGGAVAWAVPTVQVLGAGVAGAKSKTKSKTPKPSVGSVEVCMDSKAKPRSLTFVFSPSTCADNPSTAGKSTCSDDDAACAGPVDITVTDDDGDWSISGGGGVTDGGSFTVSSTEDKPKNTFFLHVKNSGGDDCETQSYHVSCSDTPPVEPGYSMGSLTLVSWSS